MTVGQLAGWPLQQIFCICQTALGLNGLLAVVFTFGFVTSTFAEEMQTEKDIVIVAFGDSLTAGYLLKPTDSFPAQLEVALKAKGYAVKIVNAGVSGDTTSGGLARLEWVLDENADAVIVELGANDALRGVDPSVAEKNLDQILARLKARNIKILLTGMSAPAGFGPDYVTSFEKIYTTLAEKYGVPLYPFFLDGVEPENKSHVMNDGLHPTAKGVSVIVERILAKVEDLIGAVKEERLKASP